MVSNTTRGMHDWLVINTQPNKERLALANLSNQGYTPYCPFISRTVRHARKARVVKRPVFPSYVFVEHNDRAEQWRPILSTFGVRTVVQMADEPAKLSGSFIESFKIREVDGVIARPSASYKVGQKVLVNGGPMDGIAAEIIELKDRDRLTVLMELLQQPVRVHMSSEMLLAV